MNCLIKYGTLYFILYVIILEINGNGICTTEEEITLLTEMTDTTTETNKINRNCGTIPRLNCHSAKEKIVSHPVKKREKYCCKNFEMISSKPLICRATCNSGCVNGICKNGYCICIRGYKLNGTRHNCVPVCKGGCVNGKCVAPNKCLCHPSFEFAPSSKHICQSNRKNSKWKSPPANATSFGQPNTWMPLNSLGTGAGEWPSIPTSSRSLSRWPRSSPGQWFSFGPSGAAQRSSASNSNREPSIGPSGTTTDGWLPGSSTSNVSGVRYPRSPLGPSGSLQALESDPVGTLGIESGGQPTSISPIRRLHGGSPETILSSSLPGSSHSLQTLETDSLGLPGTGSPGWQPVRTPPLNTNVRTLVGRPATSSGSSSPGFSSSLQTLQTNSVGLPGTGSVGRRPVGTPTLGSSARTLVGQPATSPGSSSSGLSHSIQPLEIDSVGLPGSGSVGLQPVGIPALVTSSNRWHHSGTPGTDPGTILPVHPIECIHGGWLPISSGWNPGNPSGSRPDGRPFIIQPVARRSEWQPAGTSGGSPERRQPFNPPNRNPIRWNPAGQSGPGQGGRLSFSPPITGPGTPSSMPYRWNPGGPPNLRSFARTLIASPISGPRGWPHMSSGSAPLGWSHGNAPNSGIGRLPPISISGNSPGRWQPVDTPIIPPENSSDEEQITFSPGGWPPSIIG